MAKAEHKSESVLTTDTPNLSFIGSLCCVCCENLGEIWVHNNDITLYLGENGASYHGEQPHCTWCDGEYYWSYKSNYVSHYLMATMLLEHHSNFLYNVPDLLQVGVCRKLAASLRKWWLSSVELHRHLQFFLTPSTFLYFMDHQLNIRMHFWYARL